MKFISGITGEVLESIKLNEYSAVDIFDGDVIVIKKEEEYLYHAFKYSQIFKVENLTWDKFLNYCKACGGNWSNMILSGIKAVFPIVYDLMPDREYSFVELIELIEMCGVKINK